MSEKILFEDRDVCLKIEGEELVFFGINFEIENRINNHARCNISFKMLVENGETVFQCLEDEKKHMKVELVKNDNDGNEIVRRMIFDGIIHKADVLINEENVNVVMEVYSYSYDLDMSVKNRSYQDSMNQYVDLLSEKNDLYEDIEILEENISGLSIENPIIQYRESDWEFLLRIMSRINMPILNIGAGIRCGFLSSSRVYELENIEIISSGHIKLGKRLEQRVYTRRIMVLGERVKFESGDEKIIVGLKLYFDKGVLGGKYILAKEEEVERSFQYNMRISGKAIEGTVVEVLDVEGIAKMTVDFNTSLVKRGGMVVDEEGNESEATTEEQIGSELFQFPYMTPYSQSHTGYFCTPEVGDNVVIYFPTEKEEDGFVIGAVNSIGNGRFTDRFNRNFIIPAEGSENGEGLDEPQYDMTLANNILGVTTGTTNTEVEFENLNVLEDSTTVVTNNKSIRVDNDMSYQVANNKTVQVDNNLSFNVSNDYQAQSTNFKVQASANVDAQGSSGVNIKGAQVAVEADAEATIKGGAMVKVGAPSVNVGS